MQKSIVCGLAVGLLAFAIRLLHLYFLSDSPLFLHQILDDKLYHIRAMGILDGTWPGHTVYPQGPFYPYLLAAVYSVTGPSVIVARMLGAVLGGLSASLAYVLGFQLTRSRNVGIVSGSITALCGTLVFLDSEVMPSALPTALNMAALVALVALYMPKPETEERPSYIPLLLGGCFTALSAAARGSILLFVPFALFFVWHRRGRFSTLLYLLTFAITLAPFSLHNLISEEVPQNCLRDVTAEELAAAPPIELGNVLQRLMKLDFSVVSCNGGLNFYLGNHPSFEDSNFIEHPQFFPKYQAAIRAPVEKGLRYTHEQSDYLVQETLRAQSLTFTSRNLFEKMRMLFSGDEVQRNLDGYALRQESPVLAVLLWKYGLAMPSGVLIPLGIMGMYVAFQRKMPGISVVFTFVFVHCLYLLAFFVTDRYRAEILPILAVLSTVAVRELLQQRQPKMLLPTLFLLIIANRDLRPMPDEHPVYVLANLGSSLVAEKDYPGAIALFRRALAREPHIPAIWYNLGSALVASGNAKEAIEPLETAVRGAPRSIEAGFKLAEAYEQQGMANQSADTALKVLERSRCHPIALSLLQKVMSDVDAVRQATIQTAMEACGVL